VAVEEGKASDALDEGEEDGVVFEVVEGAGGGAAASARGRGEAGDIDREGLSLGRGAERVRVGRGDAAGLAGR
jgi:hypothetical protein